MKIELTDDEYDMLVIVLGYASASALKQNDRQLFNNFLLLTNAIGKHSPNFIPYEIPQQNGTDD